MVLSLIRSRVGARQLAGGALLLLLTGCAGQDLLLPGDGVPTQLRAVSGDGQTGIAGAPVRNPLVVEALDRSGLPVPGAVVLFEFVDPPRGAAIAPATPETDDDGRAAVVVTLGSVVGDQPVEARLAEPASDLSVRFLLTAIQPNGGGGGDGDDDDGPPSDDPGDGGSGGGDDDGEGNGGDNDGGGGGSGGGGDNNDGDHDGEDERDDEGGGNDGSGGGGEGKDEDKDGEDKDEDDEDKDEDEEDKDDNSGKGGGDDRDDDRDDDDRDDDD